ncbi:MAG: hypothetical protein HQK55_17410, partial [Deltaproteobacteria bacterium]|nr:hypothetical protein [Deltaproteobacteria bacterium]
VRLAGKGQPGVNGGPPGDLYLEIEIADDPVFKRQGRDLYIETRINLFDAVLGGKVQVPTLTGRANLTVSPGTQSGRKLRLKGQGVPATGDRPAGDLYVTINIHIPDRLSPKAKEIFEQLRDLVPVEPTPS